jgi:hypothetical protein
MLNKKIAKDEVLPLLSKEALILYTWSIPHLDVEGKIHADAHILKGLVVPYLRYMTLPVIEKCVDELNQTPLVAVYGNGYKYMKFLGFEKNQDVRPDREAPSEIPDPTPDQLQSKSGVTLAKVKLSKDKIREDKIKHLEFVLLTQEEYQKLIGQFGQGGADQYIQCLNDYIGSKGVRYKSHYHTILNWSRKDEPLQGKRKEMNKL